MGINTAAIHSTLSQKSRDRLKEAFNRGDDLKVLVLSYITSNEGLNLHHRCHHNIMVEQGISYASEHQAWSRVRRIGQQFRQETTRLVNLETIDITIEQAQRERHNPMLHAFGIMEKLENGVEASAVYDALIGKQPPEALRDRVIGGQGE